MFGRFDVAAVMICYVLYLGGMAWIGLYRLGDPSYDLPSGFEELAGLVVSIGPLALRRRSRG